MDFGVVLIVVALAALILTAGGRFGTSCGACKPKASAPARAQDLDRDSRT